MAQREMDEIKDTQLPTGTSADLASALRTCLAPLKAGRAYNGAVAYVLHGTGPEVLAGLDDVESTRCAEMVSPARTLPHSASTGSASRCIPTLEHPGAPG